MDEASKDQPEVRGVRMWVAEDGSIHAIPPELADVKITKTGWPDRRDKGYAAFMVWAQQVQDIKALEDPPVVPVIDNRAQALAERIWAGQSPDALSRAERLARVKIGLEAQGLSMDGVKL